MKCLITYIKEFITNNQYIPVYVGKHGFSSDRFTINVCEFYHKYALKNITLTVNFIAISSYLGPY